MWPNYCCLIKSLKCVIQICATNCVLLCCAVACLQSNLLATCGVDATVQLFDLANQRQLASLTGTCVCVYEAAAYVMIVCCAGEAFLHKLGGLYASGGRAPRHKEEAAR